MLSIIHNISDPYFNIASEEYLLKQFSDDIFMLYRNQPSIIVGKHQNTFAEINPRYAGEHHIPVIRRLSGGGTVYHDTGNLNFTFIRQSQEGKQIDFTRFLRPILDALHDMGVSAVQGGRNDLLIDGLKISGNAEHVFKNRTLHHGTLLFSADLEALRNALRVNPDAFIDKAVKSVRSPVTNIGNHLGQLLTPEDFTKKIEGHFRKVFPGAKQYSFNEHDLQGINNLVSGKYQTWEWNYGYSPRFILKKKAAAGGCLFDLELEVDKGVIVNATLKENGAMLKTAPEVLVGSMFCEETVCKKLSLISGRSRFWLELIF